MLLGRRYLHVVGTLLLLAAAIAIALPLLEWLRSDGPSFGLYDMRGPRKLPPYDPKRYHPAGYQQSTTVYGLHMTRHTEESGCALRNAALVPADPVAILEAAPGATATLPDGEKLRVAALTLMPQRRADSPMTLPMETVYVDPATGDWMTHDAARAVNRMLGRGDQPVWWSANFTEGMSYSLTIVLLSSLRSEDIELVDLFDSRTGGSLMGGSSSGTQQLVPPQDGFRSISQFSKGVDAVRPTPLAARFEIRQGPETVIALKPEAPQRFPWNGHEYTLRNISTLQNGREIVVTGEPKPKGMSGTTTINPGSFKVVFDSLPPAMTRVKAFGKDGAEIPASGWSTEEWMFPGDATNLDHIEIRLRPGYAAVVFKLPTLPVVPKANRRTTDLMEMVLPPVMVDNEWEWRPLIASLIQARVRSQGLTAAPLTLPIELGGKTVREVLAMEHQRYPPHEVVFTEVDGEYATLERRPPGRPIAKACVWALLAGAMALALPKAMLLLAAVALRRNLRPRGYRDLTIWDAEHLAGELRRKGWRLPLRDDLATIPGVDIDDMRSVVAFMRRGEGGVTWLALNHRSAPSNPTDPIDLPHPK